MHLGLVNFSLGKGLGFGGRAKTGIKCVLLLKKAPAVAKLTVQAVGYNAHTSVFSAHTL